MTKEKILKEIKKIVDTFPKRNGLNAKCPYCFSDIKNKQIWPNFSSECSNCGETINFISYLDAIEKALNLDGEELKGIEWAKDSDINSGLY